MAVLHRFLRNSTSKCLKSSSYYISKPFSSLHAHGQRPADSQPLFTPWLAKSLNPQQHGILDLLKKSQRPPRFVPGAEISPNRGVPEGFPQLLEEHGIQRHLEEKPTKLSYPELREDSRSHDEEERLKIWADSVKKKRRKKMNKHKYKKLRKRLRRKKKK
uniref:Small ribosomal subunit protein mS38 n=1 Tax=Picea sitchensis TaxID=3332 RepID=D5AAW2_PICSI|nr:unknown [Picea sitchensis]